MKNINNHLKDLAAIKSEISKAAKAEEKHFQRLCAALEIDPEGRLGLTLFDYLYNGISLHYLQKVYRAAKNEKN